MSEKYIGKNSREYGTALGTLALTLEYEGKYEKAIEYYKAAIEIGDRYPNERLTMIIRLGNLAYTYNFLGDFDEAIVLFEKAYKLSMETHEQDSRFHQGRLLGDLGWSHKLKGQFEKAIQYYSQSLAILDHLNEEKFYVQNNWYAYINLAEIYLQKKDIRKARNYVEKALNVNAKYNLLEDYKTWAVLGKLHQQEGNYQLALENFQKQLKSVEVEYKSYRNHPLKALALSNIASVYADKKDYATALKNYQAALQAGAVGFNGNEIRSNPIATQIINKLDMLEVLGGKAATLYASYQHGKGGLAHLQAAHDCYLLMAELVNALRQGYLAEGSKHTLSGKAVDIYARAIEVALELNRATGKQSYTEQAFTFAEGNKAVTLYEGIRDQMAKGFAGIPDSLLEQERDLQAEIVFYEKKILESQQKLTPDAKEKVKSWENKVFELRAKYNKLNKLLETRYPEYFTLKYQTGPASIASIRERLPSENTALVEFMLGPQNGYVFFLTKKELSVFLVKDKAALASGIERLRQLLTVPPTSERFATDYKDFTLHAQALYSSLLKEGLAQLPKDVKRLVIIPDDVLNYLPFEVLLTQPAPGKPSFSPKQLSYLFEDYAISYHYSATLLANAQNGRTKLKGETAFLGYAPSFGEGIASNSRACVGNQLSNLTCNGKEVTAIFDMLKGRAVLSDAASTKAFLLDAPQYGILHLATHACIDETSPGLNKIFFTDGYLSQLELDQLNLNAALTVLSACNTGTGKLQHGEGVMSMARSFLLAGSASVLTSLWAVDDCTTADLMLAYYRELKDGEPKDVALQQARVAYLANADMERSHPYYWAAFVQFGDVEPLDFGVFFNGKSMWLVGAALLAFVFLAFLYFKRR
ncbi:MAG: CHAT domain-containing protein [Saprospiraceae bacterium]|nr:CHAT domain-containing protein [Saprospiraceae bacterium]